MDNPGFTPEIRPEVEEDPGNGPPSYDKVISGEFIIITNPISSAIDDLRNQVVSTPAASYAQLPDLSDNTPQPVSDQSPVSCHPDTHNEGSSPGSLLPHCDPPAYTTGVSHQPGSGLMFQDQHFQSQSYESSQV